MDVAAAGEEDLEYWKQQLTPEPEVLTLPSDRSRPTERSFAGSTYMTEFSKEFAVDAAQGGRQAGCTLFTTLLGGLADSAVETEWQRRIRSP